MCGQCTAAWRPLTTGQQAASFPASESCAGGSGVLERAAVLIAQALVTEGQSPGRELQSNRLFSTRGLLTQEKLPVPPDGRRSQLRGYQCFIFLPPSSLRIYKPNHQKPQMGVEIGTIFLGGKLPLSLKSLQLYYPLT